MRGGLFTYLNHFNDCRCCRGNKILSLAAYMPDELILYNSKLTLICKKKP